MLIVVGNPLWLMGVDAPIAKKIDFIISKNFRKISWCTFRHFMFLRKFCERKIFFMVV
jgi:hypothetical protein